jgi:hypothetical protein
MPKGHYPESYHPTDDGTGKMRDESHPSVKQVRRGLDLALEERRFRAMRKVYVRNSFAKYLGLDPA